MTEKLSDEEKEFKVWLMERRRKARKDFKRFISSL